jgi:hypothetical protein
MPPSSCLLSRILLLQLKRFGATVHGESPQTDHLIMIFRHLLCARTEKAQGLPMVCSRARKCSCNETLPGMGHVRQFAILQIFCQPGFEGELCSYIEPFGRGSQTIQEAECVRLTN